MKKVFVIILTLLLAMLMCGCQEEKQYTHYEDLGKLDGTLTYKCPRCGTMTLKVESGKSYGICSKCDEKYFIN